MSAGPTSKVRAAVRARAGRRCETCPRHLGDGEGQIHHRRPRQSGGSKRPETNRPANLLLLCSRCHSEVESQRSLAYSLGLLVHQGHIPADIPVLLPRHGWVLLTDDGRHLATEMAA